MVAHSNTAPTDLRVSELVNLHTLRFAVAALPREPPASTHRAVASTSGFPSSSYQPDRNHHVAETSGTS